MWHVKNKIPCINLCFHFCIRMINTNPPIISDTTMPPVKGVKLTHPRNPLWIWKNRSFPTRLSSIEKKNNFRIQGAFCPRHRDLDPKPLPIPNVWRELPPSHPRPEAWFRKKVNISILDSESVRTSEGKIEVVSYNQIDDHCKIKLVWMTSIFLWVCLLHLFTLDDLNWNRMCFFYNTNRALKWTASPSCQDNWALVSTSGR